MEADAGEGSPNDFLDEDGKWKCTKCGACCKFLPGRVPQNVLEELDRGDGTCKWLMTNNSCAIYENRPNVCRTSNYDFPDRQQAAMCHVMKQVVDENGV